MKKLNNRKFWLNTVIAFLVSFLPMYMLLFFGPSEIFFANTADFGFVYGDFAGYMAGFAVVAAVILTIILMIIPEKARNIFQALLFGFSLAGYIQIMFLNKNLDLMGVNPEGYQPEFTRGIINLFIWAAILIISVIVAFKKKEIWKKVIGYGSAFFLCIQVVALVSLLFTAADTAYHHEEGKYRLSGEKQYTVSADKNIIVIVLDYFSNQYLDPILAQYPDALEPFHDFTYYSNMDCTYFGTYPSLNHMLTGDPVNMQLSVSDWCKEAWSNKKTTSFFDLLSKNDYVTNVYTPDTNVLCGLNNVQMLKGKVSNVVNESQEVDIFYKLLFKTMTKMSCYRMFPDLAKPSVYANLDEYEDIVMAKEDKINHNNYDFYADLMRNGLTTDKTSNYYIMQHLMGPHLFTTDEVGEYDENSTLEKTGEGCFVIVEEYLEQLKELDVYDDATIIITADHGEPQKSQVIFFMKEAGEQHEKLVTTDAPASFTEFLPTIVESMGEDYTVYGQSIHDFSEGESRERTVWVRDYSDQYPQVDCYTGQKVGESNIYDGFSYTGGIEELLNQIQGGPSIVVPVVDSYF